MQRDEDAEAGRATDRQAAEAGRERVVATVRRHAERPLKRDAEPVADANLVGADLDPHYTFGYCCPMNLLSVADRCVLDFVPLLSRKSCAGNE